MSLISELDSLIRSDGYAIFNGMHRVFEDRIDAGKKLAEELKSFQNQKDVIVLGLARGGVVVAGQIASALSLPLDLVIVRKIGAPDNEELALGAVSDTGKAVFNEDLISLLGVSKEYLLKETERQKEQMRDYKKRFLQGRSSPNLKDQTVILVDDGIATGASMRVAIRSVREQQTKKILLAIPVASSEALDTLSKEVDEVICLLKPTTFHAVGAFYKHFEQTSDREIVALLERNC